MFTLLLVEKARRKQRLLLVFPILFLIWVNIHIGFFVGLVTLAFFTMQHSARHRLLLPVFILSFVSTLANPFGFGVYREIINHAVVPLNTLIAEWVEPSPWQIILIILTSLSLLIVSIRKKTFTLFPFLTLVFFLLFAIKARRNIPFYYTVFFFMFSKTFNLRNIVLQKNVKALMFPLLSALAFFFLIVTVPDTVSFDRRWKRYCTEGLSVYPCGAVRNFPALSGNVYAMYEWGGFLVWRKPDIKIFVDGRMPAWRDDVAMIYKTL